MLIALIPVVLMLVGGLAYILATNPKLQELGRVLFAAGAFAFAFAWAGKTVSLM